jgi:hypothetical protein
MSHKSTTLARQRIAAKEVETLAGVQCIPKRARNMSRIDSIGEVFQRQPILSRSFLCWSP